MAFSVSYYECGIPAVLQGGPSATITAQNITFYAYFIRYKVAKPSGDASLLSSADFLLLNLLELDDEVGNMTVKLNIPPDASVEAVFCPGGIISMNQNQVEMIKCFNTWIFNLVLGKHLASSEGMTLIHNSLKGYLIAPLKDGAGINSESPADRLVDWNLTECVPRCGLQYRGRMQLCACPSISQNADCKVDVSEPNDRVLRLYSGNCNVEDLADSIVTFVPNGVPHCIISVLKDSNELGTSSGCKNSRSFADHWLGNRYECHLKYKSQPILRAHNLWRAIDFLRRPASDAGTELVGSWCQKKIQKVELPPEACSLHVGVKGSLWRGAIRLPSVLYSLEKTLLAVELRDQISKKISAFKVLEALTSGACDVDISYERLELLGDSFLRFTGSVDVYFKDSKMDKEGLGSSLHDLVENKQLFHCAEKCGLPWYVFSESFHVVDWLPPGPIPLKAANEAFSSQEEQVSRSKKMQKISYRTLADVVEALVGSYLINGNMNSALDAISWLKIPIQFPTSVPLASITCLREGSDEEIMSLSSKKKELERKLEYQFQSANLLYSAISYKCENYDGGLDFGRLEFLGDSILCYLVTRYLIVSYPWLSVGRLNQLKQAIINGENLACTTIQHDLHLFLQGLSPSLKECISEFLVAIRTEHRQGNSPCAYGVSKKCSPKVLGEVLKTLAAAIFLDSGLDVEMVWKVIKPKLEPLPTPDNVTLHPIAELEQLCHRQKWSLVVHTTYQNMVFQARVIINQVEIASSEHKEKRGARRLAAMKALQLLSKNRLSFHITRCVSESFTHGNTRTPPTSFEVDVSAFC